jgi:hypothetical protein
MVHPAFIWYLLKYIHNESSFVWQFFKQNKNSHMFALVNFFLRENVILCKLF